MEKKNNNGILIGLLIGIIVILLIVVGLFATNTISLNTKEVNNNNQAEKNDNQQKKNENSIKKDTNTSNQTSNEIETKKNNRDEVISKLKEKLTNETWIKENLYSKKDCFGKEVNVPNQKLTFEVLKDKNNNPMIIVLDDAYENFIITTYKVYYDNGEIKAKNIFNVVKHPSHGSFEIDTTKNLVISTYAHMGIYSFQAYDVAEDEPKLYDEYKCETGQCEYEYKGEKTYNITDISKELTPDNVNTYLK